MAERLSSENTVTLLPWILCAVLGALLVASFVLQRSASEKRLAALQAKHAQYQKEVNGKFDGMKRQVGQLQSELAAARQLLQEAQALVAAAAPPRVDPAAARQALQRELDAGDGADSRSVRSRSGTDGFADTQVSVQDTDDSSLLLG